METLVYHEVGEGVRHPETWEKHVSIFPCTARWQHGTATPSGALLSALVTFLFHPENLSVPVSRLGADAAQ